VTVFITGCPDDVANYKIFYKPTLEADLEFIHTVESPLDTVFRHYPDYTMAGCYAISAVDSTGNESELSSPVICVDTCNYYEIPNVFTPNNDGYNDILRARTTDFVIRIDMKIYSRSGSLVYETVDPYINWDGMYNGKYVAPGVYYYHCDVYENRITGVETRHYSGFIHVITEKDARLPGEGGKK
jgi:gliding motility-associated-like protein